jgi:hypothetical protein
MSIEDRFIEEMHNEWADEAAEYADYNKGREREMKTYLGKEISEDTRGVLYLCKYDYQYNTMEVIYERLFKSSFEALNAYANIHNPESQLATGETIQELEVELKKLHSRLDDPEWVERLADYL